MKKRYFFTKFRTKQGKRKLQGKPGNFRKSSTPYVRVLYLARDDEQQNKHRTFESWIAACVGSSSQQIICMQFATLSREMTGDIDRVRTKPLWEYCSPTQICLQHCTNINSLTSEVGSRHGHILWYGSPIRNKITPSTCVKSPSKQMCKIRTRDDSAVKTPRYMQLLIRSFVDYFCRQLFM